MGNVYSYTSRFKWVTETMKDVWNNIRTQPQHTHIEQNFSHKEPNSQQHEAVKTSFAQTASHPTYLF